MIHLPHLPKVFLTPLLLWSSRPFVVAELACSFLLFKNVWNWFVRTRWICYPWCFFFFLFFFELNDSPSSLALTLHCESSIEQLLSAGSTRHNFYLVNFSWNNEEIILSNYLWVCCYDCFILKSTVVMYRGKITSIVIWEQTIINQRKCLNCFIEKLYYCHTSSSLLYISQHCVNHCQLQDNKRHEQLNILV